MIHSLQGRYIRQATSILIAVTGLTLSAWGVADNLADKRKPAPAPIEEGPLMPVPKPVCGPGSNPETALQGQVPAAMRAAGFKGFSCNLQLIGQSRGDGANWQTTEWREGKGKTKKVCGYHGTASPALSAPGRTNLGVPVLDMTDPKNPTPTGYLSTTSMLDPWESLKINERRQLLGAINGQNGGGGPEIDIYDVSGDCRYPQLLASVPLGLTTGGGIVAPIIGHEGTWAPDGLTYYGGDLRYNPTGAAVTGQYYAVDTTDTTKPKLFATWTTGVPGARIHGMTISEDGNRGYFVSLANSGGPAGLTDPAVAANNGLLIYDLSEIQARRANPQVKLISKLMWKDGSTAQHTILTTIGKKPYVIFVDEGGSGGTSSAAQQAAACAAGETPFPMARIIDISDEKNPVTVSYLALEVHLPSNCDKVLPDLAGLSIFTYGSHYCSVDSKKKATTLACGYFNSGIRVFDIRDPVRPREIAYYNPAGTTTLSKGSNHSLGNNWVAGGPDWCSAQVHMDASQGTLWTTCQDNGVLSLKFTNNAWPFAETKTPPGGGSN